MYQAIVARRIRAVFAAISAGDWAAATRDAAPGVHHVFPGDHPLGGERRGPDVLRRWFERLGRLFPGHEFVVTQVAVRGWPWSTWVAAQWTATLRPATGPAYTNDGAHWIHVRWGKVTALHAYLDTQAGERACRHMAEAGVEEAAAPPILT